MSKKEDFIKIVDAEVFKNPTFATKYEAQWKGACDYWEALTKEKTKEKPTFTDNGKLIMKYLQQNKDTKMWKSKDIAEGLFISSRTVSGAIRKLDTDGFVEKLGEDPAVYQLTAKGLDITID